jgi:ferredoxin
VGRRPFLILLLVSFPLWYAGLRLRGGKGLLDHSPVDQHTRQAMAWLEGRLDLHLAPDYLEIAGYQGRRYVSFPPVPSVVELPLVLVYGEGTPNALLGIYAFWLLALLAQFTLLTRRGFDEASAILTSLAFVFGTNLFVTCVRANVWAYGQSLGFCLAVIGLLFVMDSRTGRSGPGYLLLALAVGCRPLLALLFPLYLALDHRTCGRGLPAAARAALLWAGPVALALGAYNLARFGDPLEFGHNHLEWARKLPEGIFSLSYLPWNAYHAFLRLPEWSREWPLLRFDTAGTALWLNNAILVIAVLGLLARRFDPWVRAACAFALLTIGLGVLCYEGKGNTQFGFRYAIDLLPAAFVAFAFGYRRLDRWMMAGVAFSALLNLYGLWTWKEMPRLRAGSAPSQSTYCEMGIDVRASAMANQSFTRASCVGCGLCQYVCPRGVLKLGNPPRKAAAPTLGWFADGQCPRVPRLLRKCGFALA